MKKSDWILLLIVFTAAAVGFLVLAEPPADDAARVVVTVNGEEFGTYPLSEDREIAVNDTNYLVIKDGKVDMVRADCPDQICVKQREISKNLETIICLPNKVTVQITDGEHREMDSIAD